MSFSIPVLLYYFSLSTSRVIDFRCIRLYCISEVWNYILLNLVIMRERHCSTLESCLFWFEGDGIGLTTWWVPHKSCLLWNNDMGLTVPQWDYEFTRSEVLTIPWEVGFHNPMLWDWRWKYHYTPTLQKEQSYLLYIENFYVNS